MCGLGFAPMCFTILGGSVLGTTVESCAAGSVFGTAAESRAAVESIRPPIVSSAEEVGSVSGTGTVEVSSAFLPQPENIPSKRTEPSSTNHPNLDTVLEDMAFDPLRRSGHRDHAGGQALSNRDRRTIGAEFPATDLSGGFGARETTRQLSASVFRRAET